MNEQEILAAFRAGQTSYAAARYELMITSGANRSRHLIMKERDLMKPSNGPFEARIKDRDGVYEDFYGSIAEVIKRYMRLTNVDRVYRFENNSNFYEGFFEHLYDDRRFVITQFEGAVQ